MLGGPALCFLVVVLFHPASGIQWWVNCNKIKSQRPLLNSFHFSHVLKPWISLLIARYQLVLSEGGEGHSEWINALCAQEMGHLSRLRCSSLVLEPWWKEAGCQPSASPAANPGPLPSSLCCTWPRRPGLRCWVLWPGAVEACSSAVRSRWDLWLLGPRGLLGQPSLFRQAQESWCWVSLAEFIVGSCWRFRDHSAYPPNSQMQANSLYRPLKPKILLIPSSNE